MGTNIITSQGALSVYSAAQTTSYGAIAWSSTKPTDGVIYDSTLGLAQGTQYSLIRAIPFATTTFSTSGTTTGMRVIGWSTYIDSAGTTWYASQVIADFALLFTTGTVPNYQIPASTGTTYRPFSSIVQVAGTPSANAYSPYTAAAANTEVASALVDVAGCQLVQLQFKAASGTPTMGAFYTNL